MRAIPLSIEAQQTAIAQTFARKGFEGARMEDLAEASGIPKATLYYYFASKEDILAWLLRATLGAVEAAVREAAERSGSARQRLAHAVRALLEVMARHPAACSVLFLNLGRAGRVPDLTAGVETAFHVPVTELLRIGMEDGSLRTVTDLTQVAWILWGAVAIPAIEMLLLERDLEAEKLSEAILAVVLDGLAQPG